MHQCSARMYVAYSKDIGLHPIASRVSACREG